MAFKLGPPPQDYDLKWVNLLWKKLLSLTLSSSDFANQGTTTTVLHGNADGNPSWGPVALETDVSGFLTQDHLPDLESPASKMYAYTNFGGL